MEETIIDTYILRYYVSNNKDKYDCDLCISENRNFNDDLENVYTHILLFHYPEWKLKCQTCNIFTTNNYLEFIFHETTCNNLVFGINNNIIEEKYYDDIRNYDIDYIEENINISNEVSDNEEEEQNEIIETNYNCPICGEIFMNEELLNFHFTNIHNEYNELSELDKKEKNNNVSLKTFIKSKKLKYVIKTKEKSCFICYSNYDTNNIKTDIDYKNDKCKKYKNNNDDIKLLYVNNKKNFPLKFICCGNLMCNICLDFHIKFNNNCPYCRKLLT